ncbi:MAG TPA: hypothetical protein PKH77_05030 [Anaerolineae bacterium]|nr:hypothetical protein [Anaerolineae bacterium]
MPINSEYSYALKLQQLSQAKSWYEVEELIDYFMTHAAERQQASENVFAHTLQGRALHDDERIRKKALDALVQLERWEEIGQILRTYIDPERELADYFWRYVAKIVFRELEKFDVVEGIGHTLVKSLEGVDAAPLWPFVRNYFRRKDETVKKRAIVMIGMLRIKPGLKKLEQIASDPAQSALHQIAQAAIARFDVL